VRSGDRLVSRCRTSFLSAMIDPRKALTDPAAFQSLARARLNDAPSSAIFDPRSGTTRLRSDWDLDPTLKADLAAMEAPRPAAVLVGIVPRDEGLTLLLTQRTATLQKHAGQIAFPGGRVDETDASPVETALREAWEEIGLARDIVEPIGFLDGYRTGTGFHITPVVALITPPFSLTLEPGEVADAFEVPLSFLMDAKNHETHSREWRGRERQYWAMPYGERYIWGATAGMLRNMHELMFRR
jgi:8-oxo-dGTP pyrophosphatase MutT (NUDIX family)